MTSLTKSLPDKWNIDELLLPAKHYKYFEQWQLHPFQPDSRDHSDVNAWWMAECALLTYDEQQVIKDTLQDVKTFTKDGQLHLQWIDQGSTQGFMLEADKFILVAVRGTEFYSFRNITKNPMKILGVVKDLLAIAQLTLKLPRNQADGDFHLVEGFFNEFSSIRPQVERFITSVDKPVWLTGHSLGAAIVTLQAFYSGLEKITGLYTFGSPCVGDQDFADEFDQRGLNQICFRYVNGNDLVAKGLPFFRGLFAYPKFGHVGIEKKQSSGRGFFNRFIFLDMADHAPIYYALKCWNFLSR